MRLGDLAAARIWCAWRQRTPAGRTASTKVPLGAGGEGARSDDPSTWLTLPEAQALHMALEGCTAATGGIGVFLGADLGDGATLAGVDCDTCIGEGAEGIAGWALAAAGVVGGYAEVSPSGRGIKLFAAVPAGEAAGVRAALGTRAGGTGRKFARRKAKGAGGDHPPAIEVYLERRFFAVTGDALDDGVVELGRLDVATAAALVAGPVAALLGRAPDTNGGTDGSAGPDSGVAVAGSNWAGSGEAIADAVARIDALAALRPRIATLLATGNPAALGIEDISRSHVAIPLVGELRAAGWSREATLDALTLHPLTSEWMTEKGLQRNHREFNNFWEMAGKPEHGWDRALGTLPTVPGLSSADPPPWSKAGKAGKAEAAAEKPGNGEDGRPRSGADVRQAAALGRREDGHPVVTIRVPVHETVDAAEAAVEESGLAVFQRGGELVRPVRIKAAGTAGRETTTAALETIGVDDAVDLLSRAAAWTKWDARAKGVVWTDPTPKVAGIWLARKGDWRARTVRGIVGVPTLRWDGSLLWEPGFDAASGFYLMPDEAVRMPTEGVGGAWNGSPTKADAEAALKLLDKLLDEFPFRGGADRSVALSAMLSLPARSAMNVCPMHAFAAPDASSGKTYMVDVATAAVLGRAPPVSTAGKDEAETEKRLGSLLLSGVPIGVIDNINGRLEGDLICQAIERPRLSIRVLGLSKMREVDNTLCLFATGNNLTIVGDLVRRTLLAVLVPGVERPETREFSGNPLAAVLADRGRYLAAALTAVRAHMLAGYPGCSGMRPLASFDDWGRLVRGVLRWLGWADPVETIERTYRDDPDRQDLRNFLRAWTSLFGDKAVTVKEAMERANNPGMAALAGDGSAVIRGNAGEDAAALRETMMKVAGRNNVVDSVRLGHWMRRHKDRIMAGLMLKHAGEETHGNIVRWSVERAAGYLRPVESN